MNIQPKAEPGSPPGFHSTNPNNFETKSIHDLVMVLRGTCQWDIFDKVETVLENRYMRLREELHLEKLTRLYAESEFKKREEICEKGKKVQESYEALLKEVKVNRLANSDTIKELSKKKNELEGEVEKLKKKCVDDSNEIDVLRRKNGELEAKILELRKLKEKRVEDNNELGVLRKMIGKLEHEVSELRKSKKKWLDDSDAFDALRNKVRALEGDKNALAGVEVTNGKLKETISRLEKENSKLADEKHKIEILLGSMYKKFRVLVGRVSRLEDDTNLLKSVGASGGGNNEGESPVDPMAAANVEDKDEEDFLDDEFENDTAEEAAPLQINGDANHTLGVAASTQPQGEGNKDVQGASSGIWKLCMHFLFL